MIKKSDRQKKRKNKKKNKMKKERDLFEKITGVDKDTNAYYALKDNEDYKNLFEKINTAFNTIKLGEGKDSQETRDRALNFITRKIIINNYIYSTYKNA